MVGVDGEGHSRVRVPPGSIFSPVGAVAIESYGSMYIAVMSVPALFTMETVQLDPPEDEDDEQPAKRNAARTTDAKRQKDRNFIIAPF
jgi:hypothetical protein